MCKLRRAPMDPHGHPTIAKTNDVMFFKYSATKIRKTLCFLHVFGACEQPPPPPNKHKVQPPTAGRQPPTGSRQPPAASRQPPAANRQPPAASRQPPATVAANLSVYASWPPTCLCTPAGPTSRQPPILVSTYKTEAASFLGSHLGSWAWAHLGSLGRGPGSTGAWLLTPFGELGRWGLGFGELRQLRPRNHTGH